MPLFFYLSHLLLLQASEAYLNMDKQSHEIHTIDAEDLGSESTVSLGEAKQRGSDIILQIDAPYSPKDLDELPVKEHSTTEMSNAQLDKAIGESDPNKGQLRGGEHPSNKKSLGSKIKNLRYFKKKGQLSEKQNLIDK